MDKILLQNMVFYGYHGVYEHERLHGQRFECDVELAADCTLASQTDNLSHAIDYTKVYDVVKAICEKERYQLIEALAGRLADEILGQFPVRGVTVRIRKPGCPLPGAIDYVQVELSRGAAQ